MLRRLFHAAYKDFLSKEYLQKFLGKDCVDDHGPPLGVAGYDVEAYVLTRTRKGALWPVDQYIATYAEDDVFDMIEFLFDHVAVGKDGYLHHYNGCGMHYETFDDAAGQSAWRAASNQFLCDYGGGFELSERGEILRLGDPAFRPLLTAPLPGADPTGVQSRVDAAVAKFRSRTSSWEDRRDAVRDLAAVLEYMRPALKQVLKTKDEADLFNIANNFGIRHHNQNQRTDYDPAIWLNWMFYFYLATIHAGQRLLRRAGTKTGG